MLNPPYGESMKGPQKLYRVKQSVATTNLPKTMNLVIGTILKKFCLHGEQLTLPVTQKTKQNNSKELRRVQQKHHLPHHLFSNFHWSATESPNDPPQCIGP